MERETHVGMIGLGLLGSALAERLLEQGESLIGHDTCDVAVQRIASRGLKPAANASEVFDEASMVIICLPDSDIVLALLEDVFVRAAVGDSGRKPAHPTTVIDTTTGAPEQMWACEQLLGRYGIAYVEACVAGSSDHVRRGAAQLLVGGEDSVVASVQPLLDCLATPAFHCGGVGAGARMKLVHNLVLGLNRAALAEGLTLAEGMGFDLAMVLDVLQQTPAASEAMRSKGPKMVQRNYEPQAKLSQHRKDVRLMLQEAATCQRQLPFSQLHLELLGQAEAIGLGPADNSAIFELLSQIRSCEE